MWQARNVVHFACSVKFFKNFECEVFIFVKVAFFLLNTSYICDQMFCVVLKGVKRKRSNFINYKSINYDKKVQIS